jgi:flagellar basal body-associated protein FliL
MERRGFGNNPINFTNKNKSIKTPEENFDDVPLPAEVQRDMNSLLPKKKFNFVVVLILILVLILGSGIIYFLFFTDVNSNPSPLTFNKSNVCSNVDVSVSSLSADTCYEQNGSILKVFVERGDNSYSLKSLTFNLRSSSGKKMTYISNQILSEKGKNIYLINYSQISDVKRFEVVPSVQEGSSIKNCSRLIVSSTYPCQSSELIGITVDTGISIPYSNNSYTNTSLNNNNTNTTINLGGSTGYYSGSSSGGSAVNVSYTNNTSSVSLNTSVSATGSSDTGIVSGGVSPSTGTIQTCVSSGLIAISSCQDLQNIKNNLCGNYYLTGNIDCSATKTWNEGFGFESIGEDMQDIFSGVLDGKGYKISGLYINRPDEDSVGLFGYSEGNVSNLGLENVNISGDWAVGALVGEQTSGFISKVYSSGIVSGSVWVGGLIGSLDSYTMDDSIIVEKSYSSVNVYGVFMGENVGGFVGMLSGGGIANCYASGRVSANNDVGGFAGAISSRVINSYSTGLVSGDEDIGMWIGGFAGSSSGDVTSCYYDKQTSGRGDGVEDEDVVGEPKTTTQMKTQSTFVGWDFTNVWKMSGYPIFK